MAENNDNTIVNKVAESGLITLDPADFFPPGERIAFDLKPLLYEELILREKDFREFVTGHDWSQYRGKFVAVFCSADAIIPVWAYMLIAAALEPFASDVYAGTLAAMENHLLLEGIGRLDAGKFTNQRVVIKGCGDVEIPVSAYAELTRILKPHVRSIMYGEPCSTVPVYKSAPQKER